MTVKNHPAVWAGLFLLVSFSPRLPAQQPAAAAVSSPDPRFQVGGLLAGDDFTHGLDHWKIEREKGGDVSARDGKMTIDVPAGCTVWYQAPFAGPLLIRYRATAVGAGGQNDRVSDLNCFWMARDSRQPADLFAVPRNGKFSDYDRLWCYYVGLGGNGNSTTRFRRYVGEPGNRPLLPEHDRHDPSDLLVPNAPQTITLIASGSTIQYYREARRLFELDDQQPYTSGWFGFRTVASHLEITDFCVYRLQPAVADPAR